MAIPLVWGKARLRLAAPVLRPPLRNALLRYTMWRAAECKVGGVEVSYDRSL